MLENEIGKRVIKVVKHSDRLLLIRVKADPVDRYSDTAGIYAHIRC